MKFPTPVLAAAIGVGIASTLEDHDATNTPRILEESLPANNGGLHFELHGVAGGPYIPNEEQSLIVTSLCFVSEEDIRQELARTLTSRSIDDLILIKKELKQNKICDSHSKLCPSLTHRPSVPG